MPKVEKESRRNRDAELAALRKENEELRRQVARLRNQLQKRGDADPEEDPVPIRQERPRKAVECSKCGSKDVREFPTPTSVIRICASCSHRERVVQ